MITMSKKTPLLAYIITVDGVFDQVCDSLVSEAKESDELRKMDCGKVKTITCKWSEQDSVIEKLQCS